MLRFFMHPAPHAHTRSPMRIARSIARGHSEPPQGADGSWSSPIFIALQNATLGRLATLSEPVRDSPDWSYSRELRRDSKGRPVPPSHFLPFRVSGGPFACAECAYAPQRFPHQARESPARLGAHGHQGLDSQPRNGRRRHHHGDVLGILHHHADALRIPNQLDAH